MPLCFLSRNIVVIQNSSDNACINTDIIKRHKQSTYEKNNLFSNGSFRSGDAKYTLTTKLSYGIVVLIRDRTSVWNTRAYTKRWICLDAPKTIHGSCHPLSLQDFTDNKLPCARAYWLHYYDIRVCVLKDYLSVRRQCQRKCIVRWWQWRKKLSTKDVVFIRSGRAISG